MAELDFAVDGARFEPYSVSPLMLVALRVVNRTPAITIQNVSLQCQVRIEPARRRYGGGEHEKLIDLFGDPPRWGETLHSFLWANVAVAVPAFESERTIELPIPCSFDFNLAATKYFHGLETGEVPISLLFSGSIFYRDDGGRLQIGQIGWTKEASFGLPVAIWQAMMDHFYPNCAFLQLDRELFERLYAFKRRNALPGFDQAIAVLLDAGPAETLQ